MEEQEEAVHHLHFNLNTFSRKFRISGILLTHEKHLVLLSLLQILLLLHVLLSLFLFFLFLFLLLFLHLLRRSRVI